MHKKTTTTFGCTNRTHTQKQILHMHNINLHVKLINNRLIKYTF